MISLIMFSFGLEVVIRHSFGHFRYYRLTDIKNPESSFPLIQIRRLLFHRLHRLHLQQNPHKINPSRKETTIIIPVKPIPSVPQKLTPITLQHLLITKIQTRKKHIPIIVRLPSQKYPTKSPKITPIPLCPLHPLLQPLQNPLRLSKLPLRQQLEKTSYKDWRDRHLNVPADPPPSNPLSHFQ